MSTSHTTAPSRIPRNLLQFFDGTQIVNPRFFYKIYEGYGFGLTHRFESVADGSSVYLYFENPVGSGRIVFIVTIDVIPLGQAHVDVHRNNTITSPGTKLDPVNLNFGSNIQSVVYAEHGGSYTLGDLVKSTVCPGGTKKRVVGGAVEVGESVVIPPGYNFLVKLTNKSGATIDMAIEALWWEEPST